MTFKERWEAYQREQSHGGYEYHPGDEHIFRDAWNLAVDAATAEAAGFVGAEPIMGRIARLKAVPSEGSGQP